MLKQTVIIITLLLSLSHCRNNETRTIGNEKLSIVLAMNNHGVPFIEKVISSSGNTVFFKDSTSGKAFGTRLENCFLFEKATIHPTSGWKISEDPVFVKAQASVKVNQTTLELHVELMKDNSIFRIYCTARADATTKIKEFPVFSSDFTLPDSTSNLRWWKALEYTMQEQPISNDTHLSLNSRIHSSDNLNGVAGNVPYWLIENPGNTIGFSLAWCGGWRVALDGKNKLLSNDIYLPESETQLILSPGENIKGPELTVFCTEDTNPMMVRLQWMGNRSHLARKLFPAPEIKFPLIYNHWYAVEFDLSETYVKNQVKWFGDYGFDVFMIDAGWYKGVGSWTPDTKKFPSGEFGKAIQTIQSSGATAGLWSCPQFLSAGKTMPDYIDQPGRFNPFMNAWLIDYNAMDFSKFLTQHLDTLTNQLGAGWWKFDQNFFAEKPRSGKMKSVIAMQNAFLSARKTYPNLVFEACMSGGKMINEFTDEISQIHWICDGERTGYLHAVSNIYEALGAIGFLEPQKVQRWNNRINETDMKTPELLKFYCRSCMVGTWGISADLNKISEAQKAVILNEVKNYRQLNELKKSNLIEFNYPGEYANLIPVVFYDWSYRKAGIILYRMFPKDQSVKLTLKTRLNPEISYRIQDVDAKTEQLVHGNEFELSLKPGQLSAIYFINETSMFVTSTNMDEHSHASSFRSKKNKFYSDENEESLK